MSDLDNEEYEATKKLQEKSADELFEELGYRINKNNERTLEYVSECREEINFWYEDKTFCKFIDWTGENITMQELKAINKKCKELGWIE